MKARVLVILAALLLAACGTADLRVRNLDYPPATPITVESPIGADVQLEVENVGNRGAGPVQAKLYVSEDADISSADLPLSSGEAAVGSLGAGDTIAVALPAAASIPELMRPGNAFLGVIVDAQDDVQEVSEQNNTASIPIVVTHPAVPETTSFDFEIDGPDAVPFRLFNALVPGDITAVVEWTGETDTITVELTGRRRDSLADPTQPHATATGTTPLTVSYSVTPDDLARGVAWRLAIRDASGDHDARGTVQLTTPNNSAVQTQFEVQRIERSSGDLWPSSTLQSAFIADLSATPGEYRHGIVTLDRACKCDENRRLERAGIRRYSYLPGRHSFASVDRGTSFSDPFVASVVRYVTPLEPEDKIDPYILLGDYRRYRVLVNGVDNENRVLNPDGTLEVTALFSPAASRSDVQALLASLSGSFEALSDIEYRVTISPDRLRTLAEADFVEWIGPGPSRPMPDLNVSRATINANAVQNATINAGANTITYAGLAGNGITAGVQDTNIDATHADLNVVTTINPAGAGSHGTHVAGILAGSGVQSALNNANGAANGGAAFQWRGVAPQAGLIAAGNLDSGGDLANAINNQSMDVSNRSQSISYDGNYDTENRRIDSQIRGGSSSGGNTIPRRQLVVSAGNHGNAPTNQRPPSPGAGNNVTTAGQTGYFSITKQMKNTLVVGNWNAGTNALAGGSSLGPAYDGRLKPEVVAPGTGVTSTGTVADNVCAGPGNSSNGYTGCTGTSMAAPAVTGAMALLLQGWQNTYNAPAGLALDANPPLPSTLRALVVQTAADIVNNNVRNQASADIDSDNNSANGNNGLGNVTATVGPDYATGYGQLNVQGAVNLLQDSRTVDGVAIPNRIIQGAANQGNVIVYDFALDQPTIDQATAAGTPAVQVTLAWDDIEASTANTATNSMLVNDLDLELVAPDGTVFYPWQLGHTIQDAAGNPLADNAQAPGTTIQPVVPFPPITNANFNWAGCVPGAAGCNNAGIVPGGGPVNVDYVPLDAIDGDGTNDAWVAAAGKDHLNNLEQVSLQPGAVTGQVGHWQLRVIGFDVQTDAQDFSVVGFPYPDLPELVATSGDKIGFPAFGTAVSFDWTIQNVGEATTGTGTFDYQIYLSTDFALGGDVPLTDSHASAGPVAAIASGGSAARTSTITITQSDAATLLGDPGATVQDLIDSDAFILVHVDSGDDILEHNENNNLVSVQLARLADVVFVMDRSGSMDGAVPTNAGTRTKLSILQTSANLFLDLLRKDAGDRLGQVSFADNSSIIFDDGSGSVQDFGAGTLGNAQSAIGGLSASGKTNIRAALQDGLDLIPSGSGRRKVIVFLSDGMRTAGGDPTETAFLQQFDTNDVKVFSVGFGTEGGSGFAGLDIDLLEQLTNVGDQGFFHVTSTATGLDKFFVNAVAGAIDAELILDPVGTLAPDESTSVAIPVNDRDSEVTFILTRDDPGASLSLSLRSPEGVSIGPGNFASFATHLQRDTGPTFEILTLSLPIAAGGYESHAGTWTMVVENTGGSNAAFSASAFAESTLRSDFSLAPPAGAVYDPGDPIAVSARVFDGDNPVSFAEVVMQTKQPVAGIGDVLAAAGLLQAEIDAIPAVIDGDTLSLRERMVAALWRRLGRNPVPLVDGLPVALTESSPGVYQGVYERHRSPGPHLFVTRIEAIAEDCGPVMREDASGAGISDRTSRDGTGITVTTPGSGSGTVTVTVTPRHGGGGLVGPGFADAFVVEARGLEQAGEVNDGLDGSYDIEFRATASGTGTVDMTFRGVTLPRTTVDLRGDVSVEVTPPAGGTVGGTVTVALGDGIDSATVGLVDNLGVVTSLGTAEGGSQAQRLRTPAGLEPGLYDIRVDTNRGAVPLRGATSIVLGSDRLRDDVLRAVNRPDSVADLDIARSLRYLDSLAGELPDTRSRQQLIDEFLRALAGEDRKMEILPSLIDSANQGIQ